MSFLIIFLIAVLAIIVGSFLNVVILRLNTGYSILGTKEGTESKCLYCEHSLAWYELLPVVSFFVLRGRCRECLTRLSWQYPLVEIASAIVALLTYFIVSPYNIVSWIIFFLSVFIWWTMIVIFVYDLRHLIIPDQCIIFALVCAGVISYLTFGSWWDYLAGIILALPLALLWLVSKGRWIGLGDAKLVLVFGTLLGIDRGILFIMISFWIGAIVALIFVFFTHYVLNNFSKINLKSEIPFGPFLIIGALMVYLLGYGITDFIL